MSTSYEDRVDELARRLQLKGPDEFPTGYYEYLAREMLAEEVESET